jgi:bilirubin oxidase
MASRLLQSGLFILLSQGSTLAAGGSLAWQSPVYPLFTQPLKFGSEIQPK